MEQSTILSTITTPKFSVRPMKFSDIDRCLQIWARVELTEALSTVTSNFLLEPEAFNVAVLDETDEVIGMCAAPKCGNGGSAFIGFYGVEPKYQNLGIGRELWAKTVGQLDENLNKGLCGVPEMVDKYKKSGFIKEDPVNMLVHTTDPDITKENLDLSPLCDLNKLKQVTDNPEIGLRILDGSSVNNSLLENLIAFDSDVHGFSREDLLRKYLIGDEVPLTVAITGENNCMLGYGIIRHDNNQGGIIGPIYANNNEIWAVILRELICRFELPEGKIFTIMPLTYNLAAIDALEKIGFVEIEKCSRLFTGFVPQVDWSKIFCVHSPNFSLF